MLRYPVPMGRRHLTAAATIVLLLVACGGGAPRAETSASASSGRSGATPEEAVQLCHDQGGPQRTDYAFVASYRCPDESVPLGFDPERGAAARLGNVGQGPDGHILDLYEVPCSGRPVRIYVDGYHCADRSVDIDPNNLSPTQLLHMASQARALETVPFDPRAVELRESLAAWMVGSPQVRIPRCDGIRDAVAHREYEHGRALFMQLVASMGAAAIEAEHAPRDMPIDVELEGVLAALRLHDAIVAERGPGAADPALADLVRARDEGTLRDRVRALSEQCRSPATGMVMTRGDGQSVWPPSGPSCDHLVRCCEERGLVRGGAAVGPQGLMCLLAAAPPDVDCRAGLFMLSQQGIDCGPAP